MARPTFGRLKRYSPLFLNRKLIDSEVWQFEVGECVHAHEVR
jgi:hypothetical protein